MKLKISRILILLFLYTIALAQWSTRWEGYTGYNSGWVETSAGLIPTMNGALKLLVDPERQILTPNDEGLTQLNLGSNIVINGSFNDFTFDTDANTVALWILDDVYHSQEATGKTVIQDLAGNHDLSIAGWTDYNDLLTDMTGTDPAYQGGRALNFPGVNECLYIPAAQAADFNPGTGDFGVEFWIYIDPNNMPTSVIYLINKGYWSSAGWATRWNGGAFEIITSSASSTNLSGFSASLTTLGIISAGWYYMAFFWDRDLEMQIWVNGVKKANGYTIGGNDITTDISNTKNLYIGSYSSTFGFNVFPLAAIRYSNIARTVQEIKKSYGLAKGWTWDGVGSVSNSNFSQVVSGGGTITQTVSTLSGNLYKKEVTTDGTESIFYLNETNHVISLGNGTHDNISIRPVLNAQSIPNFVEDFSQGGAVYGDELIINGDMGLDSNSDGLSDNWINYNNRLIVSRVTGNGFSGYAQRGETINPGSLQIQGFFQDISVNDNDLVRIKVKYRSSNNIIVSNPQSNLFRDINTYILPANTGDAIEHTFYAYINPSRTTNFLIFRYYTQTVGLWMEIDDVSVQKVSNGNHGLTAGSLEADQPAHPAAFKFNGIDQYVDFGDVADIRTFDAIFFVWLNFNYSGTNYMSILAHSGLSGISAYHGYRILTGNSKDNIYLSIYNDSVNKSEGIISTSNIGDNNYHLLAVAINRNDFANVYLDGVYTGQLDVSTVKNYDINSDQNLRIGYTSNGANTYFNGDIGIAGIYIFDGQNGAPSSLPADYEQSIIKTIYNNTKDIYLNRGFFADVIRFIGNLSPYLEFLKYKGAA